MKLYTYLNYGGNCRQAFEFYAEHLGGRITMLTTHGEQPNASKVAPDWRDAVLHARIEIGGTIVFGADIPPDRFQPMRSAYLSLLTDSVEEAERDLRASVREWTDLHADGGDLLRSPIRDVERSIRHVVAAAARAGDGVALMPHHRYTGYRAAICLLVVVCSPGAAVVAQRPTPSMPRHFVFFGRERERILDPAFIENPSVAGGSSSVPHVDSSKMMAVEFASALRTVAAQGPPVAQRRFECSVSLLLTTKSVTGVILDGRSLDDGEAKADNRTCGKKAEGRTACQGGREDSAERKRHGASLEAI